MKSWTVLPFYASNKCSNWTVWEVLRGQKTHNWETYEPCDEGSQAKEIWSHSSRGYSIFHQLALNSKAAASVLRMCSFTSFWVGCCLQDYLGSVRQKPVYIKQNNFAYALVFSLPFLTACPRTLLEIILGLLNGNGVNCGNITLCNITIQTYCNSTCIYFTLCGKEKQYIFY